MSQTKDFLNKLDKYELAYFAKFKLSTYMKETQLEIKEYLAIQNLTPSKIDQLIAENPKSKLNDKKERCPRCYSDKIRKDRVEWTDTDNKLGYSDEIAALDGLVGRATYKDHIICNVCGFWLSDPNNEKGKPRIQMNKTKIILIHLGIFIVLSTIFFFSSEAILNIIAPGFHDVIMWLYLVFIGIACILILTLLSLSFFLFRARRKRKKLKCSECGKVHNELPALTFKAPDHYYNLNDIEKNEIAEISEDFCVIRHPDQTDRFIRVVLTIPINNACEKLDYGVWVSLSKKSYEDYNQNFKKDSEEKTYFGTICNDILEYKESTIGLYADVRTQLGGIRPILVLHENEHQLFKDWEKGISMNETENRVDRMMKNLNKT